MYMLRVVIQSGCGICNGALVLQCHIMHCVTLTRESCNDSTQHTPLTHYGHASVQVVIIRCDSL